MRSVNHAEKGVFYVIFVCLFVFLLTGCCTAGSTRADAADIISGNSRAAGKLEATISALDGTVNNSRERIARIIKTSRNITDGVDRIEYLFGQYEAEVDRLLNEIDTIRNKAEIQGKNNMDRSGNSSGVYNCEGYLAYIKNKIRN
ncbi:hypothetical protein E4N71_11065 [Treponema vincentii]|uniref:hypothetical protein n=1 Tax=Treponema vincentii TaxID=69710 RepID=UPI003D9454AC